MEMCTVENSKLCTCGPNQYLSRPIRRLYSEINFDEHIMVMFYWRNISWNKITFPHQEGWLSPTERASVSAISLRHILASHGHAPGIIAVNITWMKRGFNAGQTHRSIYPSIFNRLRAIARYWSEIAFFSYLLAFNAPVGVFPLEFGEKVWSSEN